MTRFVGYVTGSIVDGPPLICDVVKAGIRLLSLRGSIESCCNDSFISGEKGEACAFILWNSLENFLDLDLDFDDFRLLLPFD